MNKEPTARRTTSGLDTNVIRGRTYVRPSTLPESIRGPIVKSLQGIHEVLKRSHSHSGEQMPTLNQVLASLLFGLPGRAR